MNKTIEALFQSIGNQILDIVGGDSPKVVAYVEVQDGTVSVSIFYSPAVGGDPIFKFGGAQLSELFYSLWLEWKKENKEVSWQAVVYVIKNGRANLDVIYPDKFDASANKLARRNSVVVRYFETDKVDYSLS